MKRLLIGYAVMIVLASLGARWAQAPSLFRAPEPPVPTLAAAVAFALVVCALGVRLERVAWYRDMALFLKRLLTAPDVLGPRIDASTALVVALYSSVGEEAFFRGFVQPWLIQAGGGGAVAVALGVALTSAGFALAHPPLVRELWPWTAFALVIGVALGVLAVVSGSLLPPIVAHALINGINLMRLGSIHDPQAL
ncbi:MAG: CPBP family intramembrane metalloprotease [Planctomycetes bacterium]|nr:CPBP family intramembrane metalloprotease [Planctomycetota bacterium]